MMLLRLIQRCRMHKRARCRAASALGNFLALIEAGHSSERQLRYWMRYKRRTRRIGYEHISPWQERVNTEISYR